VRRPAPFSACVFTIVTLSSCGGSAAPPEGRAYVDTLPAPEEPLVMRSGDVGSYGGRFVMTTTSMPETFNPITSTTTYSADVTDRLFVALTTLRLDTQETAPSLASRWECSDDALSCTFHLRRGAKFSDGHPITAEDVAFTFEAINDPKVATFNRDLWQMDGVPFQIATPDAATVIVRAPKPNGNLLSYVGLVPILPKHVLQPMLKDGTFNRAYGLNTPPAEVVTSGPWRLMRYVSNERIELSRNPYWFGTDAKGQRQPFLDQLMFLIVPDTETADLMFRSGQADAMTRPAPATVQWYVEHQEGADFTVHTLGPALGTSLIFFNQNDGEAGEAPPVGTIKAAWFKNPVFRRAVAAAIDRDAIIASVLSGHGVKYWTNATPADKRWHVPDIPHEDYNPERARRLLASLGWRDRDGDDVLEDTDGHTVSFSLTTSTGVTTSVGMANFVRDDLAKIGMRVTLNAVEFNTLSNNLDTKKYDAIAMGFSRGTLDPPARFFRSDGRHPWQKQIRPPLSREQQRVDELAALILGDTNVDRRKAWFRELNTIVNEQAWVIWMPVQVMRTPLRNRFGNLRPSSLSSSASSVLWNAEEFFVAPQAQATH
jgi:peptide/nickel transport system substrate-binding protein